MVGGSNAASTDLARAFFEPLVQSVYPVSSCRAAELAKLLENTFRMVNIALVNELAQLCADQGIDTWEVNAAAATKPFGFMAFYPGPGVGGHCIPLDPAYLTWQSRRDRPALPPGGDGQGHQRPDAHLRRPADHHELNDRGLAAKGARLLALGVTYKPDVGDVRESAAIQVLAQLGRRCARIRFHDPFVARIDDKGLRLRRSRLTGEVVEGADAVLLLTCTPPTTLMRS